MCHGVHLSLSMSLVVGDTQSWMPFDWGPLPSKGEHYFPSLQTQDISLLGVILNSYGELLSQSFSAPHRHGVTRDIWD